MKVRNLKKRMGLFNEVVAGLKEGKQEMSRQIQELDAAIDALMVQIKVRETDSCDLYKPVISDRRQQFGFKNRSPQVDEWSGEPPTPRNDGQLQIKAQTGGAAKLCLTKREHSYCRMRGWCLIILSGVVSTLCWC